METWLKIVVGLCVLIVIAIIVIIVVVIISVKNAGACYMSDSKSDGCEISLDESSCKGKYFGSMDKCKDYMNKHPGYGACYDKNKCTDRVKKENCNGKYYNTYEACEKAHSKVPVVPNDKKKCDLNKHKKWIGGICKCDNGLGEDSDGVCSLCNITQDNVCGNGTCGYNGKCVCNDNWTIGDDYTCNKLTCDKVINAEPDKDNPGLCKCINGWKKQGDSNPPDCNICTTDSACGNGKCNLNDYPSRCICDTGWAISEDSSCNSPIYDCLVRSDCNNNGDCDDTVCKCDQGWSGKKCQIKNA